MPSPSAPLPQRSAQSAYRGRFAPSPTGALHMGSLLAAYASCHHARQHGGSWLLRIEDVDTMRAQPGMADTIIEQLRAHGFTSDAPIVYQSQRGTLYENALQQLIGMGLAYPCTCTRKTIRAALTARGIPAARHAETVYPGTCRPSAEQANTPQIKPPADSTPPVAWRLDTRKSMQWAARNVHITAASSSASAYGVQIQNSTIHWHDERLGAQQQNPVTAVGDFVLKRADGCYSYQLAVVTDDAHQGISQVVRGEDLADNTPRQILLQLLLGLPLLHYRHTPLVRAANGEKLSKQNGAAAIDLHTATDNLHWCRQYLARHGSM